MELKLPNCVVRTWHPGDAAALVRHANNRDIWRNMRDRFPHPYTATDAENWLQFVAAHPQESHYAIVVADEAVGGIGLIPGQDIDRRSAEIGYWLGEGYWGRGIVTEAVRALTDYAFANTDLCRVWANVFAWNPGSMRVLEKAGFAREGVLRQAATKDGQTIDLVLFARIRA
ncbi:MAG: GNAT family N-acetyltransferase [Blastocatellia bacterium]